MKKLIIILLFAYLVVPSSEAFSQQSNFMISPAPIPWFEFEEGQHDLRLSATGLYMKGSSSQEGASGDVTFYGGVGSAIYRYAFRDVFAVDAGASGGGVKGTIGSDATAGMGLFTMPFDLEFQPVKNDSVVLILYFGFSFSWMYLNIEVDSPDASGTMKLKSAMKGPQGGAQLSFKTGDFALCPFLMLTKQAGNVKMDIDTTDGSYSGSMSVATTTIYYCGFDVVYIPFGVTLSSVVQQAKSNSKNNGFRTYTLTLSYTLR
jgi:hypothetical protein